MRIENSRDMNDLKKMKDPDYVVLVVKKSLHDLRTLLALYTNPIKTTTHGFYIVTYNKNKIRYTFFWCIVSFIIFSYFLYILYLNKIIATHIKLNWSPFYL